MAKAEGRAMLAFVGLEAYTTKRTFAFATAGPEAHLTGFCDWLGVRSELGGSGIGANRR